MISDGSMREMIRSKNSQQKQIFDEVYNWSKSKCKYRNSLKKNKVNPLSVFISVEAGAGNSCLINTFFQTLSRTFNLYSGIQEKVKDGSNSVATVNINGTTINTS